MWRKIRKWTIRVSAILLIALFAFVIVAELSIGLSVLAFSRSAQTKFPGDRVTALSTVVDSESCDLRDRNHAVWALGQLADTRAVPVLEKHYTGARCDHRHKICQHEINKALRLTRSGYNPGAFLWRWLLPDQDR